MKASDIPDELILQDLAKYQGKWSLLFGLEFTTHMRDGWERRIITPGVPPKVLLAKMRALHKRGLIGGCPCGCRGDWEITDKGLALIGQKRVREYSGYGERK